MKIFKYQLEEMGPIENCYFVTMPSDAKVLTAQFQGDRIVLWATVDPGKALNETRRFRVFATGESFFNDVLESHRYLSTLQAPGGLVWHIFEAL